MAKRLVAVLSLLVFVFTLTGCATARKSKDMEIQELRNQVTVLEVQIQNKDAQINSLKEALDKTESKQMRAGKRKVIAEVKSRPNTKQIQIALRNAGFDPGPADGKIGAQTREAIKSFQRAHNLKADGKVGKITWALLKEYLYKQVK